MRRTRPISAFHVHYSMCGSARHLDHGARAHSPRVYHAVLRVSAFEPVFGGDLSGGQRPLLFQSDHSILLMATAPEFSESRDLLRQFAELQRAAGPYHVYRVTDVSLWSAAAAGFSASEIIDALQSRGQNRLPRSLSAMIQQVLGNYGVFSLSGDDGRLVLTSTDIALLRDVADDLGLDPSGTHVVLAPEQRGWVKARLAERGYPVKDDAALSHSPRFGFSLRDGFALRPYQSTAVDRFCQSRLTGGVILLPCGAGKTVVGVAVAAELGARTLVITPSRTISDQWVEHFRSLATIHAEDVTIYRRGSKLAPVTVATYQALTVGNGESDGLSRVLDQPWGLIIYDEVHSLPADVFRQSASVQSIRRLGLTATLIREDGREREVFALVGPTVYSAPWRELERNGWIAPVDCVEVRVKVPDTRCLTPDRILAAKLKIVRRILARNRGEPTLIVAHRLTEIAAIARATDSPSITGQTPANTRAELYQAFREGRLSTLVLSRVANVGVDLPDASVLIQVSGTFGSRQEEAQRVGRVLRPKANRGHARFYSLVMAGTREVEFAARRQRFLVDQGYRYRVLDAEAG